MNIFTISLCLILFINQEFINLLYFSQSYHNHEDARPHTLLGHNYETTNYKDTSIS